MRWRTAGEGQAGVKMVRRKLQAATQKLYALVELAEVHIAEAQVVEKIGIIGILAEELL